MKNHHQRANYLQRMKGMNHDGQQILVVSTEDEALTKHLMEEICKPANLNRAYKRVKANKGAAGIDGMTVDELYDWIAKHKESLIESMLAGTYQPKPVRGIEIPKPGKNKGTRLLGIPCVVDRLVQQSIHQVLEPMFDPMFSDSSYGFRPGRSAHQALKKAQEYVRAGHGIVVDVDLDKFFDRVNHDILMSKLAKRIKDKRLLKIIRCFLNTGIMMHGIYTDRLEGVSQGGPLSPFLSNLMLDDLDKELERRGHKFCRYADDANIYVRSLRAGERVLLSVKEFLKNRLKLQVNDAKSGCAPVYDRQFLGYRLLSDGRLVIAPHSVKRIEDKVRTITQRNRGVSLEQVISELNQTLRGWINYFRFTAWNSQVAELDTWIRRKVRCYRIKQRKQGRSLYNFLIKLGVPAWSAQVLVSSGKGWWRLSLSPPTNQAMSNNWFEKQGLISLVKQRALLNI